jgi:protoheme IX farnesyltransferase
MIPIPAVAVTRSQIADFVELSKPRIVLMVLLTTMVGFYLGTAGPLDLALLCNTVIGTALAAAGALALNQFIERDLDARMDRTRRRPLPEGRIDPTAALGFGVLTTALGLVYLTLAANALAGFITAVIVVTYLFAYTPLKQRTSLCSVVGAVPGALPPLAGFVAARGAASIEGWVLFAIMFLWQIPHSLAIARLYRDDYARAGMRLLPVIDPDGASTGQQVVINSLALLAVGLIPTLIGLAGGVYFMAALTLGLGLLGYSVALALWQRASDARRLLFASLVYLPVLLIFMVFDKATV